MQDNSLTSRNVDIVEKLFRDDSTFHDVAVMYNMTKERIRFIFINIFRVMQRPDLLDDGVVLPDHDCFELPVLRQNRSLWLGQIAKLRNIVREEIENPLTAHLNIPVRLSKDIFFVNTYEAFKRAFVAFNNNRQPTAFEKFSTPEYFPCFVKISRSEQNEDYLRFFTLSLPIVESMMENYEHFN